MRPGTALLLSTTILALLMAFLFASRGARAKGPGAVPDFWDEEVEQFVRERVARTYVDKLNADRGREAFYRAMDAYVDFDRYCDFITPAEHKRWKEDTAGRYAGLGIKINEVEEGLHVIGVLPTGPAAEAGLKVGDTIVRADGTALAGMGVDEITPLLKGVPRSSVVLGIIRGPRPEQGRVAGPVEDMTVVRDMIRPPTVFSRRVGPQGQFGVIRLIDFAEETGPAYAEALSQAVSEQGVKGLVLDLRNNGGGVLGVAVRVADSFLSHGVIVKMEGRGIGATKPLTAKDTKSDVTDLPLVLLVNGMSASASEVVAGALQDHRRAVLVGTRTYGKFLVQSITDIPGKRGAVKLTTSRYYTPAGRSYQGNMRGGSLRPGDAEPVGLVPDVVLAVDDAQQLELEKFWANEEGIPWGENKRFDDVPDDFIDPQMERALKLLEGDLVLQRIRRNKPASEGNG